MKMQTWTPEEREEYAAVCREARDSGTSTTDRVGKFIELMQDLEGSNAMWVRDVIREIWRSGATSIFNKWIKSQERRLAVSFDGRVLNKSRTVGRRVRSKESGAIAHEQALFDYFTWDELRDKARDYIKQISAYKGDLFTVTRLLELEDAAPGAATPFEALEQLGVSMQEWFDMEAVAS